MTSGHLHRTGSLINTSIYKLTMPFLKCFETKMLESSVFRFQCTEMQNSPRFLTSLLSLMVLYKVDAIILMQSTTLYNRGRKNQLRMSSEA